MKRKGYRRRIGIVFVVILLFIGIGLGKYMGWFLSNGKEEISDYKGKESQEELEVNQEESDREYEKEYIDKDSEVEQLLEEVTYIDENGMTLESRILTPDGYHRIEAGQNSILFYLRNLELKPDGSPVLLYDGREKGNQTAQIATFAFDIGEEDLQQCADSIIRVYAEYYWSIGEYDKIRFHLTNGFLMDYNSWRQGKRIQVNGNDVSWASSAEYDDSYENFRSYLKYVMIYAGTLSLDAESQPIEREELQAGDMLIKGGSPGHCVLVVDVAEDLEGERIYLLAQGYMPAQDFHVLKNPSDLENPWYYKEDLEYPIRTPEYTFREGSMKRW